MWGLDWLFEHSEKVLFNEPLFIQSMLVTHMHLEFPEYCKDLDADRETISKLGKGSTNQNLAGR